MNIFNYLKKLASRIRALFPERLPLGRTEFDKWSDSIIAIYGGPTNASTESIKFALATMSIHLPPTKCYVSKEFFGRSLYKAMNNQVSHAIFQEIKLKQEADRAAEAQKQAEVTALQAVPSNGHQQ